MGTVGQLGGGHIQSAEATAPSHRLLVSAAATKAWKGLEDDRKELNRLRGCVADGTCGVRIITAPGSGFDSTASAGGLGNDTIDLSADLQRRILDLRESIGQDAAKIEYLQSYALQCLKAAAR